jgi:hypothetical protein
MRIGVLILSLGMAAVSLSAQEPENGPPDDPNVFIAAESRPPGAGTPAAAFQPAKGTFSANLAGTFLDQNGVNQEITGAALGIVTESQNGPARITGNISGRVTDSSGRARPYIGTVTGITVDQEPPPAV